MNRKRCSPKLPVYLTGSVRGDGNKASPTTTGSEIEPYSPAATGSEIEAYYNEYRSSTARDYKKTITSRQGVVVHHEYARGYNSSDPHPEYRAYGGSKYREERARGRRSKVSGSLAKSKADHKSLGPLSEDSPPSEQLCLEASVKDIIAKVDVPTQRPGPSHSRQASIAKDLNQIGGDATLLSAQKTLKGDVLTSIGPTQRTESPVVPRIPDTSEHLKKDGRLDSTPSHAVSDETTVPPIQVTQNSRLQESTCDPFNHQQDKIVKIPLSLLREALQATVSPQVLASIGLPQCDAFTLGSLIGPASLHLYQTDIGDSRSNVSCSGASSSFYFESQTSSDVSTSDYSIDTCQHQRGPKRIQGVVKGLDSNSWASESSLASDVSDISDASERESESASTYASSRTSISSTLLEALTTVSPGGGAKFLPCEFSGYASCNELFHVEDTHLWSEHIIVDHLKDNLPSRCSCWFCDDIIFDSQKSGVDRYTNFMWRMEHIRRHFLEDGCTIHHIRIDCHFLDHIRQHGLVAPKVFDAARNWKEGPFSGVSGVYAHDFEPPELLQQRERSKWIAVDQPRKSHHREKEGQGNIYSQPRSLGVKSSRGKRPPSGPGQNRTHDFEKPRRGTTASDNSQFSHSHRDGETYDVPLLYSGPGEPRTSSAIGTHEHGTFAKCPDDTSNRQDCLEDLDTRLSRVAISSNHIAREVAGTEKLDNARGLDNENSDKYCTDNLHSPQSLASSEELQYSTPSVIPAPQKVQPVAQRSIEANQPRPPPSNETTREHATTSGVQLNSSSTSPSAERQKTQSRPVSTRPSRPQKRNKVDQDSDEEGNDEESAPSGVAKGKHIKGGRRFACPYFKHDQLQYRNTRVCNGPGWLDIHKVREHLYRAHRQAKHCPRCWTTFKEDKALHDHQRQQLPCDLLQEVPIEGFNETQEKLLRSKSAYYKMEESQKPAENSQNSRGKQRGSRELRMNESEKWRKIYMILFPTVAEDEIPMPYYEPDEISLSLTNDAVAGYEAQLRQELPMHLASTLWERLQGRHEPYDEKHLQDDCATAVRMAMAALSRSDAQGKPLVSESLGATTADPSAQSFYPQSQLPMSELAPSIECFEHTNGIMDFSWSENDGIFSNLATPESMLNPCPRLDSDSLAVEGLEADAHFEQPTPGVDKALPSDSGYGSIGNQGTQPWLWQRWK